MKIKEEITQKRQKEAKTRAIENKVAGLEEDFVKTLGEIEALEKEFRS